MAMSFIVFEEIILKRNEGLSHNIIYYPTLEILRFFFSVAEMFEAFLIRYLLSLQLNMKVIVWSCYALAAGGT